MTTQLVVLENLKPVSFFTKGDDVDDILEKIKKDALLHVPDLSTGKGRSAIKANITRVTESKTYLEAKGKELAVEYKAIPAKIDQNRKKVKDFLAELQVELRKPLTDWEAEQEKIKAKKIADDLAEREAKEKDELWDFAIMELKLFNIELTAEKARVEAAAKLEAERLKQVQIDNDARIAKEAAEAATIEAELVAQKKINDAQEAKQKAIDDKIKADKDLVESQAREKLLSEQAAQTKLNNEWLAYITDAYEINDFIDNQKALKQQAIDAESNRLAAVETERLAGIDRQRIIEADKKAAKDKLEADQKHVGSVRGEIKDHLMESLGVDEAMAIKIVKSLLKTKRVTINY